MSQERSLDRYDCFIDRNNNKDSNKNTSNDSHKDTANDSEKLFDIENRNIIQNTNNDLKLFHTEGCLEVGVDEVGRGSLIGRVYAAAVIWPNDSEYIEELEKNMRIRDSKKLSKKKREMLYDYIINNAIDYSVGYKDEKYIDKKNIRVASINSMHDAIDNLNITPDLILVDGDGFTQHIDTDMNFVSHICIPGGDDKYVSIAAASILAKVSRDKYISELCEKNPELDERYDILSNMGYGTSKHLQGIRKYGISDFHRKTFGICKNFD